MISPLKPRGDLFVSSRWPWHISQPAIPQQFNNTNHSQPQPVAARTSHPPPASAGASTASHAHLSTHSPGCFCCRGGASERPRRVWHCNHRSWSFQQENSFETVLIFLLLDLGRFVPNRPTNFPERFLFSELWGPKLGVSEKKHFHKNTSIESFLVACCCCQGMERHSHTTSVDCGIFKQCGCL